MGERLKRGDFKISDKEIIDAHKIHEGNFSRAAYSIGMAPEYYGKRAHRIGLLPTRIRPDGFSKEQIKDALTGTATFKDAAKRLGIGAVRFVQIARKMGFSELLDHQRDNKKQIARLKIAGLFVKYHGSASKVAEELGITREGARQKFMLLLDAIL